MITILTAFLVIVALFGSTSAVKLSLCSFVDELDHYGANHSIIPTLVCFAQSQHAHVHRNKRLDTKELVNTMTKHLFRHNETAVVHDALGPTCMDDNDDVRSDIDCVLKLYKEYERREFSDGALGNYYVGCGNPLPLRCFGCSITNQTEADSAKCPSSNGKLTNKIFYFFSLTVFFICILILMMMIINWCLVVTLKNDSTTTQNT